MVSRLCYCKLMEWSRHVSPIISNIRERASFWLRAGLSLRGRVVISKMMLLSLVWYQSCICDFQPQEIRTLQREIRSFIWEGRGKSLGLLMLSSSLQNGKEDLTQPTLTPTSRPSGCDGSGSCFGPPLTTPGKPLLWQSCSTPHRPLTCRYWKGQRWTSVGYGCQLSVHGARCGSVSGNRQSTHRQTYLSSVKLSPSKRRSHASVLSSANRFTVESPDLRARLAEAPAL